MVLGKLSDWPSPKNTKFILILSIVVLIIFVPIMGIFFLLSGNPGNVTLSQLSFSGAIMRDYYAAIPNLQLYRMGEILDYGFMVGYGLLIFSLALIIARKFDEGSKWRTSGFFVSIVFSLSACLDAIENGFILAMISMTPNFPDAFAIAHSCFSLIKYSMLVLTISWAILATIALKIKK